MPIKLKDQYGSLLGLIEGDFYHVDFYFEDFLTDTGSMALPIAYSNVEETKSSKNTLIFIPSGSSSIQTIQKLGMKNRTFQVKGLVHLTSAEVSSNAKDAFRNIVGTTGSIESEFISQTTVYYKSVMFEDKEQEPYKMYFTLEILEKI